MNDMIQDIDEAGYQRADDAVLCVMHGLMDYPGDKVNCHAEDCLFVDLYWKYSEFSKQVVKFRDIRRDPIKCKTFVRDNFGAHRCVYCDRSEEEHETE